MAGNLVKDSIKPYWVCAYQRLRNIGRKWLSPCETSALFLSVVTKHEERAHFHEFVNEWTWFIIDAVFGNQYVDVVAPPSAGRPVPIPTPSPVKNGMS